LAVLQYGPLNVRSLNTLRALMFPQLRHDEVVFWPLGPVAGFPAFELAVKARSACVALPALSRE
jgi:hypothetical protein